MRAAAISSATRSASASAGARSSAGGANPSVRSSTWSSAGQGSSFRLWPCRVTGKWSSSIEVWAGIATNRPSPVDSSTCAPCAGNCRKCSSVGAASRNKYRSWVSGRFAAPIAATLKPDAASVRSAVASAMPIVRPSPPGERCSGMTPCACSALLAAASRSGAAQNAQNWNSASGSTTRAGSSPTSTTRRAPVAIDPSRESVVTMAAGKSPASANSLAARASRSAPSRRVETTMSPLVVERELVVSESAATSSTMTRRAMLYPLRPEGQG